ncbi:MAG: uracil-DNA glycosylase [Anaerolineae bacterium]|nr:uracil-DNA glycosylase [Thermoflexales bacterium]MDW8395937.1 uracil-DNA glycosylase [Anaerolineae bacterium]
MDDLKRIADEVRACRLCPLGGMRKNAVPGEGPANAEVMLIGEGPGFHEDQQGRPFVGPSGQFLNELLAMAGYQREEVFITNVIKCRPPGNRDPLPEEIAACAHHLDRQIALINPKVIITLGRYSMAKFFPGAKISAIHGQARRVDGRTVVAMFHPAAALHQPALRAAIEEDFRRLRDIVREAEQKAEQTEQPAKRTSGNSASGGEQLSLF